ncbi:MAG: 5'/3'-nucleotidase SurE [Gammaproteobacteria bacterium]|nr:MAG: 5'/3'-nucleotidase SurE [Gammaproteobacteria bacterium]
MNILLSNDDGFNSRGIQTLKNVLSKQHDVTIFAPDRNRSGASNSLSLDRPLKVDKLSNNTYAVDGTPTDCVHLALCGLLKKQIDIVISGINHGANLGDDVHYSGTVAAAMEGRFLGAPAIAVSLVGDNLDYIKDGAEIINDFIKNIKNLKMDKYTFLNINIPNLPKNKIKKIVATRCGNRHRAKSAVIDKLNPRGGVSYWIGSVGDTDDNGKMTDFYAIENKCVSITPLTIDMSAHSQLKTLDEYIYTI